MGIILKGMVGLVFLTIISTPFLILEDQPTVQNQMQMTPARIDQAKAFLARTDPRRLEAGQFVTQWIDESEISLLINYLITQLIAGSATVELYQGYGYGQVSILLPANPIGRYINSTIVLTQASDMLAIESLTIGTLSTPLIVAETLREFIHKQLTYIKDYRTLIDSLNGFHLQEDRVLVMFQWNPDLAERMKSSGRNLIVNEETSERLLAYTRQIEVVVPTLPDKVSLSMLFTPLFTLAEARGGDLVKENRAALLAAAFYFSGVDVGRMLGIDIEKSGNVRGKKLLLQGRYDFTQHFLTSAALSLTSSNKKFADSIGIFKELDDARGGSGFSFTDVGADRAGVVVAEIATLNELSARYVQNFLAGGVTDNDYIPDVRDLPELMTERSFKQQFGDQNDDRYKLVLDDIENRIRSTRLIANAP